MRRITWLVPVLAIALLFGSVPQAEAQVERPWVIELYGGGFIPLSPEGWTDAVDISAALGATVGYQIIPKIYILANGSWGLVTGATINSIKLTDWDVFSYFLSGAYDFTEGKSVSVLGQVGVGAQTLSPSQEGLESETNFAANGGFKFYWYINPQIGLTLNTFVVVAFAEDDTIVNLPLAAGVFFRF